MVCFREIGYVFFGAIDRQVPGLRPQYKAVWVQTEQKAREVVHREDAVKRLFQVKMFALNN